MKVLVVDDLPENLAALSAVLRDCGVEVLEAQSGEQALELLLVQDIALALVDIQMPSMSGFELAELMRGTERTRQVPIIFITASHEVSRVFKGYEAGAVDYLFKPIEPSLLRSKVRVFVELHQQKRLLAENVLKLEETLRLSDLLVAVLGHDLRSPLQNIELGADLVLDPASDRASIERAAHAIRRASQRMGRLIDEILDFARARVQGGIPVRPEPCELSDVARAAMSELEAASSRIELVSRGDLKGTWDCDRLLQVLINLTRNAITHGIERTPIKLELDGSDPARVVVTVVNQGHIPAEVLPTVFEPFSRSPGHARGTGLGLYIVEQIARAHGGVVQLDSAPQRGTSVTVELPRHSGAVRS